MTKQYVQYGCGLCAPKEWMNFDASPTLRLEKNALSRLLLVKTSIFPANALYGDIVKGLPVPAESSDAVYCSHTLEHLALSDFRKALKKTFTILKPGGIFRCVVPDLEFIGRKYIAALDRQDTNGSIEFIGNDSLLGTVQRPSSITGRLKAYLGNSTHLWMWDQYSLRRELEQAGFKNIRRCAFNDSSEPMFSHVEDASRFTNALAMESVK